MRNPTRFLTLWTLFALAPLLSQWPTEVDSAIFVDFGVNPYLAIDEQEQSIIVVYRSGTERLAKKYDKYGVPEWDGSAVVLMDTLNGDFDFRTRVISDGAGGAIVCWEDYRHSTLDSVYGYFENNEIYVQRVDSGGFIQFGTNGTRISSPATEGLHTHGGLEPDYNGGFMVAYREHELSKSYLKRFTIGGDLIWEHEFERIYIDINAVDRSGNAFVSTLESGTGQRHKIDVNGASLWPDTLFEMIPDEIVFTRGRAFSDLRGGIIGARYDFPDYIVANRADSTGAFVFGEEGIMWEGSSTAHYEPDSAGGIYVNWTVHNEYYENRVQRISRSGLISWPSGGLLVSGDSSTLGTLGITANNGGGFLSMSGKGLLASETSFYIHDFDSLGNSVWEDNEVEFYKTIYDPFFTDPERWLYSDLRGGAIALWIEQGQGIRVKIKQISRDGNLGEVVPLGIDTKAVGVPVTIELFQNYPNPFNSSTTIKFELSISTQIELGVYDILGRQARVLLSGFMAAGEHTVNWDGTDSEGRRLASGVYLLRLKSHHFSATRKMLLIS